MKKKSHSCKHDIVVFISQYDFEQQLLFYQNLPNLKIVAQYYNNHIRYLRVTHT